jgi:hypothetical protein
MIEAPFLTAIQSILGGIQIQHDAIGKLLVRFQEQIHQQGIDALRVHHNLFRLGLVGALLPRTAVVVWRG